MDLTGLTPAQFRVLLKQKFQATTPNEEIYVSLILNLVDRVAVLELEQLKNLEVMNAIALKIGEISEPKDETPAMPGAVGDAGDAPQAPPGPIKDATPFPVSVKASGPPGSKPAPVVEDLTPNVTSGPPTNPQPVIRSNGAHGAST